MKKNNNIIIVIFKKSLDNIKLAENLICSCILYIKDSVYMNVSGSKIVLLYHYFVFSPTSDFGYYNILLISSKNRFSKLIFFC